jgi:cytochrome b561
MTQSRSTLHWLTVLVVAMQFVIDWTMPVVHKDTQPDRLASWPGATLVAVMAIRAV